MRAPRSSRSNGTQRVGRGMDRHVDLAAAGRIEAETPQRELGVGAQPAQQRRVAALQEMERRRHRVVRAAAELQAAAARRPASARATRSAAPACSCPPCRRRTRSRRPSPRPARRPACWSPSSAPCTVAPLTAAAACTQVRCWRIRPGFARRARMRASVNGWPVHMDSASDVRRIWPPPSPTEPSISIISFLVLSSVAAHRSAARRRAGRRRAARCPPSGCFANECASATASSRSMKSWMPTQRGLVADSPARIFTSSSASISATSVGLRHRRGHQVGEAHGRHAAAVADPARGQQRAQHVEVLLVAHDVARRDARAGSSSPSTRSGGSRAPARSRARRARGSDPSTPRPAGRRWASAATRAASGSSRAAAAGPCAGPSRSRRARR